MTMASGREIKKPVTEQDIRAWEREWAEMMVTIWRENILRLGIVDTKTLYNHMSYQVADISGQISIAHQFMLYGIYVARGVGNGYRRGNSGKDDENGLQFLGKSYRKAHGLNKKRKTGLKDADGNARWTSGKPRQKREWFAKKYLRSINVLTEVERDLYGEAYMGTLSNVVQAMFGGDAVRGENGTFISGTLRSIL